MEVDASVQIEAEANLLPIVIGDPSRGISPSLEHGWLAHAGTVLLPPITVRRGTGVWIEHVDEERFLAYFGRRPMEGEIGCAAAHLGAYEALIASAYTWGLIFEDDAVILHDADLKKVVVAVIEALEPTGRVVSLYSEGAIFPSSQNTLGPATLLELRLPPHGAVAYLIDRIAAAKLIRAQRKIASVSDWPPNADGIRYSYVPNEVIGHSTDGSTSLVSTNIDRSKMLPISVRASMITGLWYLAHRSSFENFAEYFRQVVRPRIARRLWPRFHAV